MSAPVPGSFGQLLRRYRLAAGRTQEQLAALSGLGVRTIVDLERGVTLFPHSYTVETLADALHLAGPGRVSFASAARRPGASAPQDQENAPTAGAPLFVGRASELAIGARFLAGEGPAVLLFAGEPGIGKSRLLRELTNQARGTGWRVLAGGCDQRSGREPYAPFVELLAQAVLATPRAQRASDLRNCRWLARLVPEIAEFAPAPVPEWSHDSGQERRRMFLAVKRYVDNIAGPAGTVLLLDDLHWAGVDALDLLAFLAHSTAQSWTAAVPPAARLRIVGAYRSSEISSGHPLDDLLTHLAQQERAEMCALNRFTTAEARALLSSLETPHAGSAQPETDEWAEEIIARADGVPFYLVTFAHELRPDGDAMLHAGVARKSAVQGGIPWQVTAQIRQRVTALPSEGQEALAAAAIIGRVAPLSLLCATITYPEDVVVTALETACRARLLEDAGGTTVAYQFTHDLIRETILESLGKARQALLHRTVAGALERLPTPVRERQLAALANHLTLAGEPARAMPYSLLAGDQAEAAYAHAEAEMYYRAALKAAQEVGDRAREAEALEKLGAVVTVLGQLDEASTLLDQSMSAYHTLQDQESELLVLGALMPLYGDRGEADAGAARAYSILSRVETQDSRRLAAALATVYLGLASLYFDNGRSEDQLATAKRAAALAQMAGDERLLVQALHWQDLAAFDLHREEEMVDKLGLIAQAERVGETWIAAWSLVHVASRCWLSGEFERGRPYAARAMELAKQRQDPTLIAGMWIPAGRLSFYSGKWGRARDEWEQAAEIRRELDQLSTSWGSANPPLWLGTLVVAQGRIEEGKRLLEVAVTLAAAIGYFITAAVATAVLVECEVLAGHATEALARLNALEDRYGSEKLHTRREGIALLPLKAWAHLEVSEVEDAEAKLTSAVTGIPRLYLVDFVRVQALLHMKRGQWHDAARALDEALALCRAMPYPYAEAKALWVYGRLEVARGDLLAARERFEEGLAICDRLGEGLYRKHIERDLAALG